MPLDPAQLNALRDRLARAGMQPVLSSGLQRIDLGRCAEVARVLGARLIRLALTSVLEGNRASTPGWDALVQGVWTKLSALAPQAEAAGLRS